MSRGAEVLAKLRHRGHWRVAIRPTEFVERRIEDIQALVQLIEQARVRLRGWDYPHIRAEDVEINLNFIEHASEVSHHVETWRFYQSGQFIHYDGFWDDWRDRSEWWPADATWKPGLWLGIGTTIYRFTEVFEFAARLAEAGVAGDRLSVRIDAIGIAGRQFYVDNSTRLDTATGGQATIDAFPFALELSRAALLANPREYALRGCIELFRRCRTQLSDGVLRDWQDEVGRR